MSEPSTKITPATSLSIPFWGLCQLVVALLILCPMQAVVADELRTVTVATPFLELRTGPGRGYPIFHVVDRGDSVQIVMQHTQWFKVSTEQGVTGWVDQAQMEQTLNPDGSAVVFETMDIEDFTNATWETGLMAGEFGGANVVSLYGGYSLNPNVSVELWGSQFLGDVASGWMGSVNLVHETWPEWRFSPFFTLGAGFINTSSESTLIPGAGGTNQMGHVGAGVRIYATQRFLLRAEYKSYVVFTNRDDNEEVEEWKVGFALFF